MNMRSLVIRLLALSAMTTSAYAADDLRGTIQPEESGYDWSGIHLGVGATYGDFKDRDTLFPGTLSRGDAFNVTAFAGISRQFGPLVVGLEGDYTRLDGDFSALPAAFSSITIKDVMSLRARVGVAMDRMMVYGTAGVGYAKADVVAFTGLPAPAPATIGVELDGYGAVFGAGIDYALTDNFLIGVQYQHHIYDSFGKDNARPGQVIDAKFDVVTVRASYKF